MWMTLFIGVIGGLVATIIWAGIVLFVSTRRAAYFVGTYKMLDQYTEHPSGGVVRITYSRPRWYWKGLVDPTQILDVAAEHGTGKNRGTEDWRGKVQVLGLSGAASGFYCYVNNQEGGTLLLRLRHNLGDDLGKEIIEDGTPNHGGEPFTKILRRM